MKKTYKYRLYPTKHQQQILNQTLESCRLTYNYLLDWVQTRYKEETLPSTLYDQNNQLPILKQSKPELKKIHSQVLQDVSKRLFLAFKSFFRRVSKGQTPGYPRFKGEDRYDSFTYPQWFGALKILDNNRINLPKIGNVKMKYHRSIEGKPKVCTIRKSAAGKWYVTIVCDEIEGIKLEARSNSVGIDLGLSEFATLSDGNRISNPRFFRQDEKDLARAQRQKKKKVVAKIYDRIKNRRHNFVHQEARKIVDGYQTIVVEDLKVNQMKEARDKNSGFRKSIADAAWGIFLSTLECKAVEAGRLMLKVNPAYTSQTCSGCGSRRKLLLSQRLYECDMCGLSIDRDLNAAINIMNLGLGTQSLANA